MTLPNPGPPLLREPAPRPCKSCPYRLDAPVGLWADSEYDRLPPYDEPETAAQPPAVFGCHQQDGRLCAGWVAVHDMTRSLALRIGVLTGDVDPDALDAVLDYTTTVPLHPSGRAACDHGKGAMSAEAVQVAQQMRRRGLNIDWDEDPYA